MKIYGVFATEAAAREFAAGVKCKVTIEYRIFLGDWLVTIEVPVDRKSRFCW